jgi:hypothetical protein
VIETTHAAPFLLSVDGRLPCFRPFSDVRRLSFVPFPALIVVVGDDDRLREGRLPRRTAFPPASVESRIRSSDDVVGTDDGDALREIRRPPFLTPVVVLTPPIRSPDDAWYSDRLLAKRSRVDDGDLLLLPED